MIGEVFKDYRQERKLFTNRTILSGMIIILCFLGILIRLIWLQVQSYDHFQTLSQGNRIRLEPIPPIRGLIYETHSIVLAKNLPAYALELIPEKITNFNNTIAKLRKLISISDNDIKRFKKLRRHKRRFDSVPIRTQLTEEEIASFAVNSYQFREASIQVKFIRHYPVSKLTAHVLGYVGRINRRDLKRIDSSQYSGTSHIGKIGLEKTYEHLLHGQVGTKHVEINARGRVLRTLESHPALPGHDLFLYLDLGLQEEASRALGQENGALVAIDPRTGGILAFVSHPTYDTNLFVTGISHKSYNKLLHSPDRPLYNRALRGQYPPGSTIKPFVALAGLETEAIQAKDQIFCPGYYQLPGHKHKFRGWKRHGHGMINLNGAIAQSCDIYFYVLARNLGVDTLHAFLSKFGFGRKTNIDLVGELGGLLPSKAWKLKRRKAPWYPGETLILGIGQGYMLATPLQLASATATLATKGRFITPRIVRAYRGPTTNGTIKEFPKKTIQIAKQTTQHWSEVITAMRQVVESSQGTAKSIFTNAYSIAGKTGTAQVFTVRQNETYDESKISKKMRDHALFVAFAPIENPRIAVAILVENGGHGGAVAAPIARRVMDHHLLRDESSKTQDILLQDTAD